MENCILAKKRALKCPQESKEGWSGLIYRRDEDSRGAKGWRRLLILHWAQAHCQEPPQGLLWVLESTVLLLPGAERKRNQFEMNRTILLLTSSAFRKTYCTSL